MDAWAPVFFFVMIFAISMDYTVFLLASAREHWDRSHDPREAMVGGLADSGRVIFAAAAVMVAVFFTFALSGPLPPKEMGVILGVSVLLDAMLVRLVLLPALMRRLRAPRLGAAAPARADAAGRALRPRVSTGGSWRRLPPGPVTSRREECTKAAPARGTRRMPSPPTALSVWAIANQTGGPSSCCTSHASLHAGPSSPSLHGSPWRRSSPRSGSASATRSPRRSSSCRAARPLGPSSWRNPTSGRASSCPSCSRVQRPSSTPRDRRSSRRSPPAGTQGCCRRGTSVTPAPRCARTPRTR